VRTAQRARRPEAGGVEIAPWNREAVRCFAAMSTQWRTTGDPPMPQGLDYSALAAVVDLRGIKKKHRPAILDKVRIMEAEALPILQRQVKQAHERRRRKSGTG